MGRIAAIDFGLKRIGIALSDAGQQIAFPLTTVEGGKRGLQNVVGALSKQKGEIDQIIVGLPLLLNGKKGDMAAIVEKFGAALESAIEIPVLFVDERLSSKQADRELSELSLNRRKRAEKLDQTAAAFLLQSYLEKRKLL
jgi:putative Holliday junction resolvase